MSTRYDTDPGSKSADEVEREVQQSRAEVEEALEAIQERLSPGQLFDQAVDYMRGSGGNEFLRNLGATVRDNPVPIVLMSTGLAWLMLAGPRARRRIRRGRLSRRSFRGALRRGRLSRRLLSGGRRSPRI